MITFFAPAVMCFCASAALVKIPVDSTTTSALTDAHGRFAGSLSEKTLIVLPSTVIESSVKVTGRPSRPRIESYLSRWARVSLGVRSLIPTMLISGLVRLARKKLRPMRPKPLIPTLIMIESFVLVGLSVKMKKPRYWWLNICHIIGVLR